MYIGSLTQGLAHKNQGKRSRKKKRLGVLKQMGFRKEYLGKLRI